MSEPTIRRPRRPMFATYVVTILASMLVGGGISIWVKDRYFSRPAAEVETSKRSNAPVAGAKITLQEGKLKQIGVRTEQARIEEVAIVLTVAGTIEADPYRRVDVRPRASGIVRTVNVQPSSKVKTGDLLALLESADVATARLNVRARQLELGIARTEADWRSTIAANVELLIPMLIKGTPASQLEKKFAAKPLGAHRAELLSAYADLEIASHEEEKQSQLYRDKIVGEHQPFVAQHTRESAQAKFEAALEQVRFDAAQQKRVADQMLRRAEGAVIDAVKRLQILGVNEGLNDPLVTPEPSVAATIGDDVTAYPVVAPFAGTILSTSVVPSQRAEPTDVLFTLADLARVRVVANIAEADMGKLPQLREASVSVSAAAYPGRTFEAKMLFSGSMVDATTRRVRLVAEAENRDGLLRLGMFVNVHLSSPSTERVLTVPATALVEIDGREVVFIAAADGRTFEARPVIAGRESAGRRVVTAGLTTRERVVSAGAFMLKSELILQNEPEED
jgi:membrane fusion protein, heavy metal efflux system